ncbi:hypothetical protein T310_6705, partial [Rasamsonia emersonii CBS 393.64]
CRGGRPNTARAASKAPRNRCCCTPCQEARALTRGRGYNRSLNCHMLGNMTCGVILIAFSLLHPGLMDRHPALKSIQCQTRTEESSQFKPPYIDQVCAPGRAAHRSIDDESQRCRMTFKIEAC